MDYNEQLKNKNFILIGIILIGLGSLFGFCLNKYIQANIGGETITNGKTTISGDNSTGVLTTTGTINISTTKGDTNTSSGKTKKENKRQSEPVLNPLRAVGGGWLGDNEYERVINRMIYVGVETGTAEFIAWKCYATAKDPKNCVKGVLGIATAESSLFKRCYMNNCFGIKPAGQIAGYDTLLLGIDDWINRYNKNWYNNHAPDDYILRSHYCRSRDAEGNIVPGGCEDLINGNRKKAFNSTVAKLGF